MKDAGKSDHVKVNGLHLFDRYIMLHQPQRQETAGRSRFLHSRQTVLAISCHIGHRFSWTACFTTSSHVNPRLIIADEHQILIDGLTSLLHGEYDIVGTATDGARLLELTRSLQPDLILTDIDLPVMDGAEVMAALAGDNPLPRVIFLTQRDDPRVASQALRIGGAGYVVKDSPFIELHRAIREVLAGRRFISPRIGQGLLNIYLDIPGTPPPAELAPFTARQIEVLRSIAKGLTTKETAAILGISIRTAESHKYHMMERNCVRTVAELIRLGIHFGVFDMPRTCRKVIRR